MCACVGVGSLLGQLKAVRLLSKGCEGRLFGVSVEWRFTNGGPLLGWSSWAGSGMPGSQPQTRRVPGSSLGAIPGSSPLVTSSGASLFSSGDPGQLCLPYPAQEAPSDWCQHPQSPSRRKLKEGKRKEKTPGAPAAPGSDPAGGDFEYV